MPVLVSNQTSNTNNGEQTYEQEDSSSLNGLNSQTSSHTQNEPVVNTKSKSNLFLLNSIFQEDLFKILDESPQTNGNNAFNTHNNIFDLLNTGDQPIISSSNPLEDILFGDDLPKTQSTNGTFYLFLISFSKKISSFQV